MNKDNILFAVIGVLLGFIGGFLFANSVNQRGLPPPRSSASAPGAQAPQGSALPPDHPPTSSNSTQDINELSKELKEAVEKAKSEPTNFDAQVAAAKHLYENRLYDQAIEYFTRANQLRPDSYETLTNLGNTYFDAGKFDLAEKWYNTALAKRPNDVNVRTDLGLSFFFRKPPDPDRAIKEFRAALKSDPNHEQTLINLIVVLSEKGDIQEARNALAQLERASPNNSALPKLRDRIEEMATKKKG
ncbi:MAG TPA: tetratricopeptide repeat protein [Pyrinomonadaceae bacterium]|jgi:tetratricopeptide (TPR) repeat protein